MNFRERFSRLRPTKIKKDGQDTPYFHDVEQGISFIDDKHALQFLSQWATEHGREMKYPLDVQEFREGSKIDPGMYTKTNFTSAELSQSMALRHAHEIVAAYLLVEEGVLGEGQALSCGFSKYQTPEGYVIFKHTVIDLEGS